ncbi:MAG: hypothetical protein HY578_06140 [Nitrospinae bacterium]|nr:hypothetical protein [Nitrospinota bacterium]
MRYLQMLTLSLILINVKFDYAIAAQSKQEAVLKVFKNAIELNEDFKNSVKTLPLEVQQKKRIILEQYQEKELSVALSDCVSLLSSDNDTNLALSFFDLLLSLENSADETLAYAFGEVFLNNPDLVIRTFDKLKRQEHKTLYPLLEWGWKNITTQKNLSEAKIHSHIEKLKRLKSRIDDK